jgi:hypothetical protein
MEFFYHRSGQWCWPRPDLSAQTAKPRRRRPACCPAGSRRRCCGCQGLNLIFQCRQRDRCSAAREKVGQEGVQDGALESFDTRDVVTARPCGMRSCRWPVVAVGVVGIVGVCAAERAVIIRVEIAARLREVVATEECRGDNCQRKYPIHVWVLHSWGLTHYGPLSKSRDATVSMGNHATRKHRSNLVKTIAARQTWASELQNGRRAMEA